MTSNIDATKPVTGSPTTAGERANWAIAKSEISALQAASGGGTPSTANPLMDGTAAPGTATPYSREDHRHPTDTSRASTAVATTSAVGLVKPDGTSILIDVTGKISAPNTGGGGFTPGGTTSQLLDGTGLNVTVGTGLTLNSTTHTLTAAGGGPALPGGTAGQVQFNSGNTALAGFTMSGDATLNTATGAITVTKANGAVISTTYAPLASPNFTGSVGVTGTVAATGNISTSGTVAAGGPLQGDSVYAHRGGGSLGGPVLSWAQDAGQIAGFVADATGKITWGAFDGTGTLTTSRMTLDATNKLSVGGVNVVTAGGAVNQLLSGTGSNVTVGTGLLLSGGQLTNTGSGGGGAAWAAPSAITTSGATQALAFPASAGRNTYVVTLASNAAFSFTGLAASVAQEIHLIVKGGAGGFSGASLPASSATMKWPGGVTPTLDTSATGYNEFIFRCVDGTVVSGSY